MSNAKTNRDYYVAVRQVSGNKFAITRRSASANGHWKVNNNTVTHIPVDGPNIGKRLDFIIVHKNLSWDEGTILKDFIIGAMLRMGKKQVGNGH